ncbi:hypothetical protein PTE30175_04094 [Pandoraea terrae]|uniref:Uncharacterized protein n=1 Tax=Pandoraea terrae TaxID=1537710 RepID=A0A5E4XZ62_9BURK|nr:hypothetical protein [Pandoraea terrae]VVE41674.1 hypothetical protein PTE30175_04094 [Pandoraea terrae]
MKKNYANLIRQLLMSEGYQQSIEDIHVHHKNVKNEARYRDALLKEINKQHGAQGLVAYAEVERVDLVLADRESSDRVRIEFKYQYTFDMAYPVASKVDEFDALRARVAEGGRGVAELIVADCDACDFFVLIVQDRTGHPASGKLAGDVDAAFIEEQRRMDREFGPGSDRNKKAWLEPTQKLLDSICQVYGGRQLDPVELVVGDATDPLTSHFFVLDMTGRCAKAA